MRNSINKPSYLKGSAKKVKQNKTISSDVIAISQKNLIPNSGIKLRKLTVCTFNYCPVMGLIHSQKEEIIQVR